MIVRDVSASVRFYRDALGFEPVQSEEGWALLRRGDAEVFLEARDRWPAHVIPLHLAGGRVSLRIETPDAARMREKLPGDLIVAEELFGGFSVEDPDGVRVTVLPDGAFPRRAFPAVSPFRRAS